MNAIEMLTTLSTPQGQADPYPLYAALHELGEVIALLGAGNRDQGRFTNPDRFDQSRTDAGSLSFGGVPQTETVTTTAWSPGNSC